MTRVCLCRKVVLVCPQILQNWSLPEQVINLTLPTKSKYILKSILRPSVAWISPSYLANTPKRTAFVKSHLLARRSPGLCGNSSPEREYCTSQYRARWQSRMYRCCIIQVNYENVDNFPKLCTATYFAVNCHTGQLSFDFIQVVDQTVYAIECNPALTPPLLCFTTIQRRMPIRRALAKKLATSSRREANGCITNFWCFNETGSLKQPQTWIKKNTKADARFEINDHCRFWWYTTGNSFTFLDTSHSKGWLE